MKISTISGKPLTSGGKPIITEAGPCACSDCGGPPPTDTGACCIDGVCSQTTEEGCSGVFQGIGVPCSGGLCESGHCDNCGGGQGGACCVDGVCSNYTAEGCANAGGNFLGEGTSCDEVDCAQGACCFDTDCELFTESDCIDNGGIYQGDGSACDLSNPCNTPCDPDCGVFGFMGSGTRYLVKTVHIIRTAHIEATMVSPDLTLSDDYTTTTSYNPYGCTTEVSCSGTSVATSDADPGLNATCNYVSDGVGGCTFSRISGSGSCNPLVIGACIGCSPTPSSDTVESCTCDFSDPTTPANVAHYEQTVTLSEPFACPELSPPP